MSDNSELDEQVKRFRNATYQEPINDENWVRLATDNQPNDGSLGWSQDGEWVWRGKEKQRETSLRFIFTKSSQPNDKQANTEMATSLVDKYPDNGLVIEYRAILAKGKEEE